MPATFDDVAAMCLALPEVVEGERMGRRTWFVGKKALAWERPLTKADIKRWGDDPLPEGEIVALATDDLAEKEAILAAGQKGFFTMQHFDGYPAFLIELQLAGKRALKVAIEDAWLAVAPDALAQDYLAGRKRR
jgi:hypothetical protein